MNLKCEINGKTYDIVNGAVFSEEYNETLDSGSIIITGVERQPELRPFDDVYIYDSDSEFKGYQSRKTTILDVHTGNINDTSLYINKKELDGAFNRTISDYIIKIEYIKNNVEDFDYCTIKKENGIYSIKLNDVLPEVWYALLPQGMNRYRFDISSFADVGVFKEFYFYVNTKSITMPTFYRHYLIDNFSEERLNPVENLYKYKISLFSEVKKLERIQLPNISITQPLNITLKKSVAEYIRQFVSMYTPVIKVATSNDTYAYLNKYEVDDSIDAIFGDTYCPNFSLDNPSLRTLLNQLFLVKDRIPYVKDDVIYALDMTERKGNFSLSKMNTITGSRSSENHSTSLKRNYKDALSGRSTARKVEYIGFRNSDNALLTIANMRVETKFPIYKINKIYMCYYKKAQIWTGSGSGATYTGEDKVFLCKQDITKLVKLDEEEATLSKDWNDFTNNPPSNINEMAQYKLCTLTYSIGSNKIEGWGTSYSYPMGWWGNNTITKTYIENIFDKLEEFTPYGIYTIGYLSKELEPNQFITVVTSNPKINHIVTPIPTSDGAKRLKSFFFLIDYEAFYNGTVFTSKDNEDRDDIVVNDNPSSSLTLLEKDGLFQKEKANRFGNMAYTYYGTYDDISELQDLGSVDNSLDEDVIIYHREYQIFENYIRASYFGSKDYVLKNYFTSVYAKHRPFNLLPYSQSIIRAENRKVYLMLSKEKSYYEMINSNYNMLPPINFNDFASYMEILLSFAKPNPKPDTIDKFIFPNKINYGYIYYSNRMYANDINVFTNGYSLCMNISMWDNISMGNYISDLSPQMPSDLSGDVTGDLSGSVQSYYPIIDNSQTGFTQRIGFFFSHTPDETFSDMVFDYESGIENTLYNKLLPLPLLNPLMKQSNIIGKEYVVNKDNKEIIDMTYQIEPYTNDKNVLFSEWLLKLCDLYGVYSKFGKNETVYEVQGYLSSTNVYCGTTNVVVSTGSSTYVRYYPMMCLKIDTTTFSNLQNNTPVAFNYGWGTSHYDWVQSLFYEDVVVGLNLTLTNIVSKTSDSITFDAKCVLTIQKGWWGGQQQEAFDTTITLYKRSRLGSIDFSSDTSNYYFCSGAFTNDGYYIDGTFGTICRTGHFGDNNTSITDDTTSFDGVTTIVPMQLGQVSGVYKTYNKNMYVRTNDFELKKTLVYDEYQDGELDLDYRSIDNFITIESDQLSSVLAEQEKTYIKIDLTNVPNTKKSIEFWYSDRQNLSTHLGGTLHFVFGVNLSSEDFERGYVKIYASLLTKKDTRVFDDSNKVVGEIVNYEDSDKNYGEKQYYVLE